MSGNCQFISADSVVQKKLVLRPATFVRLARCLLVISANLDCIGKLSNFCPDLNPSPFSGEKKRRAKKRERERRRSDGKVA